MPSYGNIAQPRSTSGYVPDEEQPADSSYAGPNADLFNAMKAQRMKAAGLGASSGGGLGAPTTSGGSMHRGFSLPSVEEATGDQMMGNTHGATVGTDTGAPYVPNAQADQLAGLDEKDNNAAMQQIQRMAVRRQMNAKMMYFKDAQGNETYQAPEARMPNSTIADVVSQYTRQRLKQDQRDSEDRKWAHEGDVSKAHDATLLSIAEAPGKQELAKAALLEKLRVDAEMRSKPQDVRDIENAATNATNKQKISDAEAAAGGFITPAQEMNALLSKADEYRKAGDAEGYNAIMAQVAQHRRPAADSGNGDTGGETSGVHAPAAPNGLNTLTYQSTMQKNAAYDQAVAPLKGPMDAMVREIQSHGVKYSNADRATVQTMKNKILEKAAGRGIQGEDYKRLNDDLNELESSTLIPMKTASSVGGAVLNNIPIIGGALGSYAN